MSSVLSTSTMKSPPLELWLTGSAGGGIASAAAGFGPGTAALARGSCGGDATGLAAAGAVVSAAAPARVAPLRKFRRPLSGALLSLFPLRFLDMIFSPKRNRI